MNSDMRKVYIVILFFFAANKVFAQGNDVCASGTLLVPTAGNPIANNFVFSTSLTASTGLPDPTGFYYTVTSDNEIFPDATICKDIWYRVQVPASGGVAIDLFHTSVYGTDDLAMAVYDGCSGNLIAAADDYYTTSTYFEPSVAVSCRTPGSILYVRIWQYGCTDFDLPSNFQIVATDQADLNSGDAPGNATVLPNTVGTTTTNLDIDNTLYPLMSPVISTSLCSNAGYAIAGGCEDRWFKITLTPTKILDVFVENALAKITMQVFSGTACSLTEVACGDGSNPKLVDIAVATTTDFFIRVFDKDCDEYDNFDLITTIRNKNNNDLPCSASVLTLGAAAFADTLINNTPSNITPIATCAGNGSYCRDVWYRVTATSTGNMKIITNVTGNLGVLPNSIYLSAYNATTCNGPFMLVACKSPVTNDSIQYFQNTGDISYIRIQDYNCDTNAHQIFTIRALQTIAPPNDEMCNARALNPTDTITGFVTNGTQSTQSPNPTCNFTTVNICEDVWYAFTFPEDGTFNLKTVCLNDCAPASTTNIAVFTDGNALPCDGSALTQLSCNSSAGAITSIPCLEGFAGNVFYFRIYDYDCNNANRAFTLYTDFIPAGNSVPCYARSLDFGLVVDTAETCGVISSPAGVPNPSACGFIDNASCESVWFKATVPTNGNLTVTINPDYIAASTNDIAIQAYIDADNNPCNGGLVLQGTCSTGNAPYTKAYTGLTSGSQLYFRLWDFNCNGLKDFSIQVTSNNDVLLTNAVNGTTISVACGEDINFYDEGGSAANYPGHPARSVSFEAPIGYRLRIEEQSIDISPAKTTIGCVNSNSGGNDVLTVYDGNLSGNKIAEITGNLATTGRFGSFVTNSGMVTFYFDADNSSTKAAGFHFVIKCEPATFIEKQTVALSSTITYTDAGGLLGNYPNNSFEIKSFCPTPAVLAAGEKIQAILNGFQMESVADKLYIFDGDSTNAPLIGSFSGAQTLSNINKLGTIRASATNATGCLTFMFVSDATVNAAGFNATITTGEVIGPNGGENCAAALDISAGGKFQANTFLSTGDPRNTDPNLCIPTCLAGVGTQPITQLEGTIWYKFTTPDIACTGTNLFTLDFTNVSTLIKGDANASYPNGTSGAQIVLYQTNSCIANPANWNATKVICYDILQNGGDINVSGLTPNTTYYLMLDNFGGRPTNLDIVAKINVVDNNGDNICDLLPVELISFSAKRVEKDVVLNWETATELNNDYFTIQRSLDAITFTDLTPNVKGAGTTVVPQSYNFIDKEVFDILQEDLLYYRLKQTDFDGSFSYSSIHAVQYKKEHAEITIYPNPTSGWLQILNFTTYPSDAILEIIDLNGNNLISKNVSFEKGTNLLDIDISMLSNGAYFIRITDSKTQTIKSIIKS
jgi:hypothetical protein